MKSVYVGMSGGVDSSVAALLLKQEGYDVTGFTLDLWGDSSDYSDIKEICDQIGIKHEIISIRDIFKSKVVEPFLDEYKNARTPNPCVFCNKYIKFGYMIDYIKDKADFVATGHYAKVIHNEKTGRYYFEKSADEGKDQTYMFYTLSQEQISKIMMPLGKYQKNEIREIAKKYGIQSADSPDSQDICFLEGKDLTTFIKENAPDQFKPGDIVNKSGKVLGKHNGISCYTIGQRRGLGVASEKRIYVVEINAENNTVVLDEEKYLFTDTVKVRDVNFLPFETLEEPIRVTAKIRYKAVPASATLEKTEYGVIARFDSPVRAATPGQSIVFYDGNILVGGGIIM